MITNRSKRSAIQTSGHVCVPVSLQNITLFPHPYFFCVEQKLTHCIILPQRRGKKIFPHSRINSGRFCFLFALSVGSEEESPNKKNGLGNSSGHIRCPCTKIFAALVSKGVQGTENNFSEHFSKRTGRQ